MRSFVVALAFCAQQALASGGKGSNILNEVMDFGEEGKAPRRFATTINFELNKETQNKIDFLVYVKNNDLDRAKQEFHGDMMLHIDQKPAVDQVIAVGFYFGLRKEIEEAEGAR